MKRPGNQHEFYCLDSDSIHSYQSMLNVRHTKTCCRIPRIGRRKR